MPRACLDQQLLNKLAKKTGKSPQYIRERISRRASRQSISSEAAQIVWAKEFGIATTRFQRSLPAHIQEEVRTTLPSIFPRQTAVPRGKGGEAIKRPRTRNPLGLAIEYLLSDDELRRRCGDLLRARGKFDRVIREATTVLDDRLKGLAGITARMNPADLVGKVLNPDPRKALLKLSDEADEQQGLFMICKGLFLAFRNPAHHKLTDKFKREDALRFCGFVDAVLAILEQAQRNPSAN